MGAPFHSDYTTTEVYESGAVYVHYQNTEVSGIGKNIQLAYIVAMYLMLNYLWRKQITRIMALLLTYVKLNIKF